MVHCWQTNLQNGQKFDWDGGRSVSSIKDAMEAGKAVDPSGLEARYTHVGELRWLDGQPGPRKDRDSRWLNM